MAVRRFETDAIPADIQAMNLNGYQLTELGFAVNKFDAASTSPTLVTDNSTVATAVNGITASAGGDTITFDFNTATAIQTLGVVNFVNKNIIVDGGVISANNINGTHFNFYNCNIGVVSTGASGNNWTIGSTVSAGASGTRIAQTAGGDRTLSKGVNFYGCSMTTTASPSWFQVSDAIDCTLIFGNGTPNWHTAQGGRWINLTMKNGVGGTINPYGATRFAGLVPDSFAFRLGNSPATGQPNITLFDRPTWEDPNQTAYIDLNQAGIANAAGVVIGGPYFGESVAQTFGGSANNNTTTDAAITSADFGGRISEGVLQCAAIGPTYLDEATRNPIPSVRVRMISNINHQGFTGATYGARIDFTPIIAPNRYVANQGLTNANGRLVTDRYLISTNDGESFVVDANGYVNYLDWNAQTVAPGQASFGLGTNPQALVANTLGPDNVMFSPIMRGYRDGSGQAVVEWTLRHDRRSYSHAIDVNETIAPPAFRGDVYVDDGEITASSLVGVRVKEQNINATTLLPEVVFNGGDTSLQDIANAVRSFWSQYRFNPNYDPGSTTFPDAGPFNENTYPLNIILSPTAPVAASGDAFGDYFLQNGAGFRVPTGGIDVDEAEIIVHTDELTTTAGDIAGNNPTNIHTLNAMMEPLGDIDIDVDVITNLSNLTGTTITTSANLAVPGTINGATINLTGASTTLTIGTLTGNPSNLTAPTLAGLQNTTATRETFTGHTFNGDYTFTTSNPTLQDITWEGGSPVFVVDTNNTNALIISGSTDLSGATLQNAAVQYVLEGGATLASAFGGTAPTGWVDASFNTISPDGTLAEIRARGGYFNVVDISNGNSVLPGGGVLEITSSTTMAQMTATKGASVPEIWRAIYKPRTVFGGPDDRLAYQTTILDYGVLTNDVLVPFSTFSDLVIEGALPGGVSAGVAGNPLAVYSLIGEVGENDIVGDGTTATNTFTNAGGVGQFAVTVERVLSITGGVVTELTRDDGGAAGTYSLTVLGPGPFEGLFSDITINGGNVPTGTTIRIFFSIGNARAMRITLRAPGNVLDANETQTLSLAAANTEQYVQIHSDYSIFWDTNEMFSPGPDSRSVWTGQAQGTQWLSGDPFTTQQRVSNLEGLISGQAGTAGQLFDQVIDIPAVSASLSTVAAAVSAIVGEELMDILENQVAVVDNQNNMQTAIQRGAVKAATYSAGELTTSTSDNFNNPTDDA